MTDRTCTVSPCKEPTRRSTGLCEKHHGRWKRRGTTDERPKRTCTLDDCNAPHEAKGLCAKHYERLRKHGSVESRSRVRTTPEHQAARARKKSKAYYWRHRDRIRAARRAEGNAYAQAYRAGHRERHRAYGRRWYRANREQALTASKRWCRENPASARINWHRKAARRRVLKRNAGIVENVRPIDIFERDGWTCHLCSGPIDPERIERYDPQRVSLDHIIAVAAPDFPGHVWENLAAAHLQCNIAKGDTVTTHDRALHGRLARQRAEKATAAAGGH